MGADPAARGDGHLQRGVRQLRGTALGRPPLRGVRLRRRRPVALLLERDQDRLREPGGGRVAGDQGLLPAHAGAGRCRAPRTRRPRHIAGGGGGADGPVRRGAGGGPAAAAGLDRRDRADRARGRALAVGAERALPRHPLDRPVPPTGVAVRQPRGLSQLADRRLPREAAVRAEPVGRGARWVPLVAARRPAARGRGPALARVRRAAARHRPGLLQARRAPVRRPDLMAAAIVTEGLGKRYRLGERGDAYGTLRSALSGAMRRRHSREELWALRDVDLVVEQGEVVGVIGRNGAGKTTLLKLITRITEPTTGVARMRGRVGALLEVGTGFHFELTGRENVFFNGAVLGMSRAEIERRFDEIVEFAGVGRFLDTPLKRYSAGMYLRLAFSVAAHLEPDNVMVDEVLAVGDTEFQRKCIKRMSDLTEEGRTVMFVSHDLGAIGRLCERVVWIDGGRIRDDGGAEELLASYQRQMIVADGAPARAEFPPEPRARAQFLSAALLDEEGRTVGDRRRDLPLRIELRLAIRDALERLDLGIALVDRRGAPVVAGAWSEAGGGAGAGTPGSYRALVTVPGVLSAGDYTLRGWITTGKEVLLERDLLEVRLLPRTDEREWELVRSRVLQPRVRWSVESSDGRDRLRP